jgi:hypothetical protein
MNSGRIIWMTPVVAGAMLLADGTAQGQVQTLDITEHSSSLLTVKFNGTDIPAADIVNTSGDHWTITLSGTALGGGAAWAEPGSADKINNVFPATPGDEFLFVISDIPSGGGSPNDNGTPDTTHFRNGGAPLSVTFTDNAADGPTGVPDAAATLSLLSLSLAGLGILRKTLR